MGNAFCTKCGHALDHEVEVVFCPFCGEHIGPGGAAAAGTAPGSFEADEATRSQRYKPEFTGSAGEYFRIWIVNTFLTIVTLGIYGAWAKVRNRQYFYKNTVLDGHSFDYTANPVAILKGYLIIGTGLVLYNIAGRFKPQYALIILGIFFIVFPFLVYKSLRFFSHNSLYRNIRFRFLGTLRESYATYVLYPLLIPFTLGFIVPYWAFRKKKYFFNNVAYGASGNVFQGRPGPFFTVYIVSALIAIGVVFIGGMIMAFVLAAIVQPVGREPNIQTALTIGIIMYVVMLVLATFFQQYIYAWTTNYCWGNSQMGGVRFISTLNAWKLYWIRLSNIVAIILSLGLLAPWAQVRRTRYILENLAVVADHSLNDVAAATSVEESAYGDAATDFFDLEIGL